MITERDSLVMAAAATASAAHCGLFPTSVSPYADYMRKARREGLSAEDAQAIWDAIRSSVAMQKRRNAILGN